jgi:hypothetical protein
MLNIWVLRLCCGRAVTSVAAARLPGTDVQLLHVRARWGMPRRLPGSLLQTRLQGRVASFGVHERRRSQHVEKVLHCYTSQASTVCSRVRRLQLYLRCHAPWV